MNGEWGAEGRRTTKWRCLRPSTPRILKDCLFVYFCGSMCFPLSIPFDFSARQVFPFSLCPDLWPSQGAILRQGAGHGDAQEDGLQCHHGQHR